jgi:hypothetical protein
VLWHCTNSLKSKEYGVQFENDLKKEGIKRLGSSCDAWERGKNLLNLSEREQVNFT